MPALVSLSVNAMHNTDINYSGEREIASPFASAAAQGAEPSFLAATQPFGSPSRSHQGAQHPQFSPNNLSEANGTTGEDAGAALETNPTSTSQLVSASSLSALSPFANAPALAPSLSSSSVASSLLRSVKSDQKSQKSSPLMATSWKSSSSNAVESPRPEGKLAAALGIALAAPTTHINQRNVPMNPPSPFLGGHTPAGIAAAAAGGDDDLYGSSAYNLFPVPESAKEGHMSSSDISTPHFPGSIKQQQQQNDQLLQPQLLQHLHPGSGSGGGSNEDSRNAGATSPEQEQQPQSKISPSSTPAVYYHSSGMPRLGRTSSTSSPQSPVAPTAAAGAAAFPNFLGDNNQDITNFALGGVQLSPEQFQIAALQAMQSGRSYASTLGRGSTQSQEANIAQKLLAYQQSMQQQQHQRQVPAVPAGVVPPPPPLYQQEAALHALQQQQSQQQQPQQAVGNALYSPPRIFNSWGHLRGGDARTNLISAINSPDGTSMGLPGLGGSGGGELAGSLLPFPAARYSISRDSGGGVPSGSARQRGHVSSIEQKSVDAAALLQRVQLSTKHLSKVRALLNTGGKFVIDADSGNLTYKGGEVRLVSLPEGCTFPQLLAVLAKTDRPGLSSPSPSAAAAFLKGATTPTTSRKDNSTGGRNSLATATAAAAAQTLIAAAASVSALIGAQEAAAADAPNSAAALDAESYATYAMHVARAHCLLRYQLPSDPTIFVDVVDDEDVQLMFEEIAELKSMFGGGGGGGGGDAYLGNGGRYSGSSSVGGGSPSKLRLFVQWIASPPGYINLYNGVGGVGGGGGSGGGVLGSTTNSSKNNTIEFIDSQDHFLSPMGSGFLDGMDNRTNSSCEGEGSADPLSAGGDASAGAGGGGGGEYYYSAGGVGGGDSSSLIAARNTSAEAGDSNTLAFQELYGYGYPQQQPVHAAHRSASELRLAGVRSDQLECIPASEVTLLELLGTGHFGDMYAGKWRECTVAVKCLNPSAVGLNYTSQAAWVEFLHDANSTAALRHPNLVEVYGIVLPGAQDERSMRQEIQQRSESVDLALKAAGDYYGIANGGASGGGGGLMIDPKMSGRRTSWDFGTLRTSRTSSISSQTAPTSGATAAARTTTAAVTPFCAGFQRLPGPCMSTPAIVMEYVKGKSLHGAIRRKDDAVAGALARILYALDTSRGMAYLHHRGIFHFDLKSTNILLGWRNMRPAAKIAGYGLSTRKSSLRTYTPGVTMTPNVFPWVAPEILRNPEKVSNKADIFSFGIVLWELWALRAPYENVDMNKLVSLAVNTDEEVRPELPPPGSPAEPAEGWEELVKDCWAEDPDDRPEFAEIEKRLTKMAKAVKNAQRKPEEPLAAKKEKPTVAEEVAAAVAVVLPTGEPKAESQQEK